MNVNKITAAEVRNDPQYQAILDSAREYDRVYTAAQNDPLFKLFFKAKEALKKYCIVAYTEAGKTPADLYTSLFGNTDGTNLEKNDQRVYNKIVKHISNEDSDEDPEIDPVMISFTVDDIKDAKLGELYGTLKAVYELLEAPIKTVSGQPNKLAEYKNAKKGETGIKKVLKPVREKLKDDSFTQALKAALEEDGVKNPKTLGKVDGAAEKAKTK